MNILVTYGSHYGHTARYARWIARALGCDCVAAKDLWKQALESCDVLIHGGGLYAGGLAGIGMLKRRKALLEHKELVIFTCGLADPGDPENTAHIRAGLARALPPELGRRARLFHLRGGIDYPRLSPVHRGMMAMLRASLLQKDPAQLRDEDRLLLRTYGCVVDHCDEGSIQPLITYVRSLERP